MQSSHVSRLSAFGAVMEIVCDDPDVWELCAGALPAYWWAEETAPPDVRFAIGRRGGEAGDELLFSFAEEGRRPREDITAARVRALLSIRMDYLLGAHARGCAFIHAGLVLHGGRAIVLPGASRAGKSTLTAALVRAGAEYVSDDVAVIGGDGRVHLLTRQIALRPDMAGSFAPPIGRLPATLRDGTASVAAILFLSYREGAPPLDVRQLSAGEAVLRLAANSMNGRRHPDAVLTSCAAAASLAFSCDGVRGDCDAAAALILHGGTFGPGAEMCAVLDVGKFACNPK
jgi:hypothetical protein